MFDSLSRRLTSIFAGLRRDAKLTEEDVATMVREIRVALLEADVNFAVAKKFVAAIKEKAVGEAVFGSLNADQTIIKIVRDELTEMLGGEIVPFNWGSAPPTVILLCGLQGSGKTTTAAKLASWMVKQGKKPMLAACDIQRPAAIKQLQVLGEQIDVPVEARADGTSAPEIARLALERAKYLQRDVLIVDTAGRLTIDDDLMQELGKVNDYTKPHERLLVLDTTIGQEAVNVAEAFNNQVGITGVIFTKLDGDTRGGAVLSVREATGVPVRFIGVGEGVEALDQFYPDRMAGRILGMGDVLGIIERAEQAVDQEEALDLEKKLKSGNFDFNLMLQQFQAMKRMGPIKNIMKMLPGVMSVPEEALDAINEKDMGRIEAIILSMTLKERTNPDIINSSRRKRIAAGAGSTVEEVNRLINQVYSMRRQMKQLTKMQEKMKGKKNPFFPKGPPRA